MRTITITPTWESLVPAFVALIENGTAQGRAFAITEVTRMARVADMHLEANLTTETAPFGSAAIARKMES